MSKYDGKSPAEREHLRSIQQAARNRRKTLSRYNLDPDDYARMLRVQDGRCAVCLLPPDDGALLVVDHCHSSGLTRGLLHDNCNKALGFFRDDTTRLARAIDYVTHHRAVHARRTDRQQLPIWD